MIGSVGEFDIGVETWSSYIERFELFCECNDIKKDKKVCTLLSVVGVKTYSLLRNLCTPEKPADKTFADIVKIIESHLYPKPSFIAERYKFSKRNQLENENISEYIANLKRLSIHCEFGALLNDYLRDRLVSGIRSESTKQKLLAESSLTYEEAVKIILSVETAEKNASILMVGDNAVSDGQLQQIKASSSSFQNASNDGNYQAGSTRQHTPNNRRFQERGTSKGTSMNNQQVTCFCCGRVGHYAKECRLWGCTCRKCGKKNHIALVCRSSGKSNTSNITMKHNYVGDNDNEIVEEIEDNFDGVFNLCNLGALLTNKTSSLINTLKVDPITVPVTIGGKMIKFEVDSGACVSVISENDYHNKLSHIQLNSTNLVLSSYVQEHIKPVEMIQVMVGYKDISKMLDLYVVANGANHLLGRDWIQELQLAFLQTM
ncbi:uncharacterized protein LOC120351341 [Nilaparvata lugens]|uniref:uncharacterized protein LOC120351341 n=1 Tax=Nilaparvata lugens TaxID=108931 RepID=UPI00193D50A3|nr:uncharacterized protein LOC120351341 [Nilaparvata lugens]